MGEGKRVADQGTTLVGPPRAWPPTCGACGAVGAPSGEFTPYVACGGDPGRHQRPAVRR
jgi:hypothetical protein